MRIIPACHNLGSVLGGRGIKGSMSAASTTAGFEVKFVVSNGFSGLAAGGGGASATRRVRPRGQVAGPRPDATAGGALRAR